MADGNSSRPSENPETESDAPRDQHRQQHRGRKRQRARVARRKIRFEQVRSIGILLTLGALLGLVLYNTFAPGNPWSSRPEDVRLLMTVLSVLLGVDVILGNRAAMVRLLGESLEVAGRALVAYIDTTDGHSDDETETTSDGDDEQVHER